MPSPDTESAASSNRSASGRRLISHITSPFKAKSRTVSDFHVTVDDPHRQYSPGDEVTGHVSFNLFKPIRLTHIVVVLHGYVQVYKNPNSPPAEGYRVNNNVGSGRGTKSGEYFGNGFASLFEDESILCGDGRLNEGRYQFRFELLFPDRDLPSSISFERGTISYMITATLTRPTTISPTLQADHKVYLVERIDIAQLLPPKSRTITLEPIRRRTRAKAQARKLVDGDRKSSKPESSSVQSNGHRSSLASSAPSLDTARGDSIHSPAPSEISSENLSQSAASCSARRSNAPSPGQSDAGQTDTSKGSTASRTITATVEQMTGGCLRGDNIPVRVHVTHTKYVKSLYGVIITLYRQARVDMHPSIPVGPTEKGKEGKYEDYYPKSITGLGGLSLSGAGSSHVFRKDLAQTIMPLIVDPTTLTADVRGKVQVPDEAFPTISTVPGAMISFKYYVEVVLDIQGKLGSSDRNFGNLGGLASTITSGDPTENMRSPNANGPFSSAVIDTASVRRDKGVVACTFEVVVGTKDSQRKGKRKVEVEVAEDDECQRMSPQLAPEPQANAGAQASVDVQDYGHYHDPWYGGYDPNAYAQENYHYYNGYGNYPGQWGHPQPGYYVHPPPPIPMPRIEDESQLPEKERLRMAEERLLPSQPNDVEDLAGSSSQVPTAPYIPEEQLNTPGPVTNGSVPIYLTPSSTHPSTLREMPPSVSLDIPSNVPPPRTSTYEPHGTNFNRSLSHTPGYDYAPSPSTAFPVTPRAPTDDKNELRRLEQAASAPPMDEAEADADAATAPSAPILQGHDDELYINIHDSHVEAEASTDLPRYER